MAHSRLEKPRAGPRQDTAAYTLPGWRSRSPLLAPMKRASQHQGGAKWSGGMTLFGNRSPRTVVLRRKRRTFADAGGACRAVIGCILAGGAGGLRPGASGLTAGAQAVFPAVL